MNTAQLLKQYYNHVSKDANKLSIKIGNNLMDVFSGEGWAPPTRYRLVKGAWVYQQGPRHGG